MACVSTVSRMSQGAQCTLEVYVVCGEVYIGCLEVQSLHFRCLPCISGICRVFQVSVVYFRCTLCCIKGLRCNFVLVPHVMCVA
jgi:hypothetical protein